jgi:hypothetical protein
MARENGGMLTVVGGAWGEARYASLVPDGGAVLVLGG